MKVEVTEEERELLEHAGDTCSCESYYSYKCQKCRRTGKGYVTSRPDGYKALIEGGLVYHNSYHGLRPTKAGAAICKALDITVWSVHSGRGVEQEK